MMHAAAISSGRTGQHSCVLRLHRLLYAFARAVLRNLGVANVDVARKEPAHDGAAPGYLLREASPIGPNWHRILAMCQFVIL
jgi:hypothetical protein